MKSIQFIGTQRSGSNLLRVMLHQHPEICSPHPPHILQVMMPFLPMYGDLSDENNFEQLIGDVCTLVELNPVSWGIKFDRAELRRRCAGNNLPQVMKAVYEMKTLQKGASSWACKSMANIHYAAAIEEAGILPFYIFIFRDGRDVALSFMKAIVGEKHIYHLAKQWKEEQELSIALCKRVGEERSVLIPYEAFISEPETHLQKICGLLDIAYSPAMLDYAQSDESKETASSGAMWGNLVKPVMKENKKKFLTGLTEAQVRIFESVAGETLLELGYSLQYPEALNTVFTPGEIAAFDRENQQLKKQAKEKADPADVLKRKAQDAFVLSLRERMNIFQSSLASHE